MTKISSVLISRSKRGRHPDAHRLLQLSRNTPGPPGIDRPPQSAGLGALLAPALSIRAAVVLRFETATWLQNHVMAATHSISIRMV